MMKLSNTHIGIGMVCLALLSGCKSFSEYQEDRIAYAVKHFERAQHDNLDPGRAADELAKARAEYDAERMKTEEAENPAGDALATPSPVPCPSVTVGDRPCPSVSTLDHPDAPATGEDA